MCCQGNLHKIIEIQQLIIVGYHEYVIHIHERLCGKLLVISQRSGMQLQYLTVVAGNLREMAKDSQLLLVRNDIYFFAYCKISNVFTRLTHFSQVTFGLVSLAQTDLRMLQFVYAICLNISAWGLRLKQMYYTDYTDCLLCMCTYEPWCQFHAI